MKIFKNLSHSTRKGPLTASEDYTADTTVLLKLVQGYTDFFHETITESVESLWPIQLYQANIALLPFLVHENVFKVSCQDNDDTFEVTCTVTACITLLLVSTEVQGSADQCLQNVYKLKIIM